MRVIQIIDSLEPGGAERVAVNLANALAHKIDRSFLCTTRKEGLLKESINSDVGYLFLSKKGTFDLKAVFKLRTFLKRHDIDVVHAHSSSFFIAVLVKVFLFRVKIIWHDHYGNSEFLSSRKSKVLAFTSYLFSHILCVNETLKNWAINNLHCKNVIFLPNFSVSVEIKSETILKGTKGKRIVHLANLRPQKNHEILIKAFNEVLKKYPDWTLHCVGKDFNDAYSKSVKRLISKLQLENQVYLYGSCPDVFHIL
ncbi:glycosyltransferase, partial [Seonamhaeicola sp.]|uniref:glycosyltransferase n=1 Tax=Seonamhaeicola sp. TaxID=1912245 RepID=UPI003561A88B